MKIIYGYEVNQNDDEFVSGIDKAIRRNDVLINRVYMVDYFPICELFPLRLLRRLEVILY